MGGQDRVGLVGLVGLVSGNYRTRGGRSRGSASPHGERVPVPSPSIDWLGMFSGLMSISYAFDAVLGTDRGGADSGRVFRHKSPSAVVTKPFPSAPRPSEQAPRDAHSVRMCGVSRGSYMLRRGCACGSGDGSAASVRESAAKASDRAPRQRHAPLGAPRQPRHGLASPPRATLRAGGARPRRVLAAWRWGLCGRGGGVECLIWKALMAIRTGRALCAGPLPPV